MGSLSEVQQEIILGCVLGDGYMRKKTNAHLQITHSFKQKDYVDWKYNKLKNIVITPPKTYKGNGNRIGYRFFTRSIPQLTNIHDYFYDHEKIKRIPSNIVLKPQSLAVWYMDDGNKSYNSCYLNTQKFDSLSQNNLMIALLKLGIESNLNKDKEYYRIRVATKSVPNLIEMIKPFIISSMRYKLPL